MFSTKKRNKKEHVGRLDMIWGTSLQKKEYRYDMVENFVLTPPAAAPAAALIRRQNCCRDRLNISHGRRNEGGSVGREAHGVCGAPPDFLKKYVFRSKSFSFKRLPHQKVWSSHGPIEHQSCQIAIWAPRCIEKPQHFPKFSFFWLWFCLRMNEICNSFNGGT